MFGQNLKRLRERRGFRQIDVAAGTGIDRRQISKWETGKLEPDIRSLCLLADFFGVSIDYLVGRAAPQLKDIYARMRKLLDSLTPEQVSLPLPTPAPAGGMIVSLEGEDVNENYVTCKMSPIPCKRCQPSFDHLEL